MRSIVREVAVFDHRSAVPDTGASTVFRLADSPVAARDALLSRLQQAALPAEARPARGLARPVPLRAGAQAASHRPGGS